VNIQAYNNQKLAKDKSEVKFLGEVFLVPEGIF
jgi:hypothetical protein